MKKIHHPAVYSDHFIPIFAKILIENKVFRVLDPMAGTGKLALVKKFDFPGEIYCNEIEREWVNPDLSVDGWTFLDAAHLSVYEDGFFDGICTSPAYGNRLADSHCAKDPSRRVSYTYNLGHPLHPANTGHMQWGLSYRIKHLDIYTECHRLLRPDGLLVVNISNHIRQGKEINVVGWTKYCLNTVGFRLDDFVEVETPRMRYGANRNLRVAHEIIMVLRKV